MVTKSKYIHSNDSTLTQWRHHMNKSVYSPIKANAIY